MNPYCIIAFMLLIFLVVFIFNVDKIRLSRFTNKENFQVDTTPASAPYSADCDSAFCGNGVQFCSIYPDETNIDDVIFIGYEQGYIKMIRGKINENSDGSYSLLNPISKTGLKSKFYGINDAESVLNVWNNSETMYPYDLSNIIKNDAPCDVFSDPLPLNKDEVVTTKAKEELDTITTEAIPAPYTAKCTSFCGENGLDLCSIYPDKNNTNEVMFIGFDGLYIKMIKGKIQTGPDGHFILSDYVSRDIEKSKYSEYNITNDANTVVTAWNNSKSLYQYGIENIKSTPDNQKCKDNFGVRTSESTTTSTTTIPTTKSTTTSTTTIPTTKSTTTIPTTTSTTIKPTTTSTTIKPTTTSTTIKPTEPTTKSIQIITTPSIIPVEEDFSITNQIIVEKFEGITFYKPGIKVVNLNCKVLTLGFFFKTSMHDIDIRKIQMIATSEHWRLQLKGNIFQFIMGGVILESPVKVIKNTMYNCVITIGNTKIDLYIDGNHSSLTHNIPDDYLTNSITFGIGHTPIIDFNGLFSITRADVIRYRVLDRATICQKYEGHCINRISRFIPRGDTIQQCVEFAYIDKMCNQYDKQEDISNCQIEAQKECYQCNNSDNCLWINENDLEDMENPYASIPSSPYIKCLGLDSSIKVDWIEPDNGGSKITSYMIVVYEVGKKRKGLRFLQMTNRGNKNCEYIINGLKNQVYYNVYVVAINNVGMSDLSNMATAVTTGELLNEQISEMLLASNDEIKSQAMKEIANETHKYKCRDHMSTVKDDHILNDINRQSFANSVKQHYSNNLDEIKNKLNNLNPDW